MWNTARHLLLLACLLYTVSCHRTKPGHYHIVLRDNPDTKLHDHIVWANKINQESGSGYFGVQDSYDCPIGKGYFAHISGKTAKEIEQSDEVLHIIPQSTWSLETVPPEEEIIVDDKIDPKNWGLVAISSNPPTRDGKGPYRYHESQATGTYIYILDSGIQSDDKEFQGRAIHGWAPSDLDGLDSGHIESDLKHGTFVAGIAGGVRHGVAKNATLIDVQVGYDKAKDHGIWDGAVWKGLCWTANDILQHNRVNKSVINLSLGVAPLSCASALFAIRNLAEFGVTVVVSAGNDGEDVKNGCLTASSDVITVGAFDRHFNAAAFSNHGTGVTVWAPGVEVRSVLSKAALAREKKGLRWPKDTWSGTSFAAPHVSGMIAGWMGETEEGLSLNQVLQKLDELSHKNMIGADLFLEKGVPEDEWEHRVANNRMAYNGADGVDD